MQNTSIINCISEHLRECVIHDSFVACIVLDWKTAHNIKYYLLIDTITRTLGCHAVPSLQRLGLCGYGAAGAADATERPSCRQIHAMLWHGSPLPIREMHATGGKLMATSPSSSRPPRPHLLYILRKPTHKMGLWTKKRATTPGKRIAVFR
jgi:hypothetical protein